MSIKPIKVMLPPLIKKCTKLRSDDEIYDCFDIDYNIYTLRMKYLFFDYSLMVPKEIW